MLSTETKRCETKRKLCKSCQTHVVGVSHQSDPTDPRDVRLMACLAYSHPVECMAVEISILQPVKAQR